MIVERDESSGARAEERREHLKRLGDALTGHDFETELGSSGSGVPLLAVTNPDRPGLLCDTVICCADRQGALRFAWPRTWIGPVDDLSYAVAEIRRVLGGADV